MTDIEPAGERDLFDLSFSDLIGFAENEGVYRLRGLTEVDKSWMVGVPHAIIGLTWWKSSKVKDRDFVTVEAKIGDEALLKENLKRGWLSKEITSIDQLRFQPEEMVYYNDGGTGVRRQVTELCHASGLIDIGEILMTELHGKTVIDSRSFDRPFWQWDSFNEGREQTDGTGGKILVPTVTKNHNGNQFVLMSYRGLYASEYSNEFTDEGLTWYLK